MSAALALGLLAIPAGAQMPQVVLTEADVGRVCIVPHGEDVLLRLPETPSTGYRWSVAISPPEDATVQASHCTAAGQGAGAPGTRDFTLRVTKRGEVTLSAKLWREWAGEASTVERLTFTLDVQ